MFGRRGAQCNVQGRSRNSARAGFRGAFETGSKKAGLASLLTRLKGRNPPTEIIARADEFAAGRPYPFFVKAGAFGTASTGVLWRVGERTPGAMRWLRSNRSPERFAPRLAVQPR